MRKLLSQHGTPRVIVPPSRDIAAQCTVGQWTKRVLFSSAVIKGDCPVRNIRKIRCMLGFSDVEVGVHLIENRPHLKRLCHVLMGKDALTIGTEDFAVLRGKRVPMRSARVPF